jgi:hypothetical protein
MLHARKSLGSVLFQPRYFVGNGTNWSSTASWATASGGPSGASVPTANNDVILNGNSPGNLTIDVAAFCRSLDCTGGGSSNFTHTLTHNSGTTLSIGSSNTNGTLALKFNSTMTYTHVSASSSVLAFVSTSSVPTQITTAGRSCAQMNFTGVGGSWILEDTVTLTNQLQLVAGTVNTNGQTVNTVSFSATGTSTRTLTLGASAINISYTASGAWNTNTTTGMTFNAGTSTITFTGAGAVLGGGGLSFNNVAFTGAGTVTISGTNTFNNFSRSNAAACGLTVPSSVTQTINGTLSISGASSSAIMTLTASSSGTAATISMASGTVSQNYMSLKDQAATGGATFHAGAGSSIVSNVTGWQIP